MPFFLYSLFSLSLLRNLRGYFGLAAWAWEGMRQMVKSEDPLPLTGLLVPCPVFLAAFHYVLQPECRSCRHDPCC